jgi:diguanylate cyclase (GGDEF)-like protein
MTTLERLVQPCRWGLGLTGAALATAAASGTSTVVGMPVVTVAGAAALGAVALGAAIHYPDRQEPVDPLWLLGAGVAILVATSGGVPGAWWLVVAAAAYPILTAATLRLISGRMPGRDADMLVDGGLAATAFGLVLWVAIAPIAHPGGRTDLILHVALAALDFGLLTMIGRLLLLPGDRLGAYSYLGLGSLCLVGTHVTLAIELVHNVRPPTDVLHALMTGAFVCFGLGALDPSVERLSEPLPSDPPTFSPGHTILVCAAVFAVPLVAAKDAFSRLPVSATVAVGAALTAPVLAAYVATLLWDRAQTEQAAHHDTLTGLPNRALFLDRVSRAVAHAKRNGTSVAVMVIDLDRFKVINDTYGHPAGDQLLVEVANRMRRVLREEDTVARMAGDEFTVLLPHLTTFEGVITVTEKLMAAIRQPLTLGGSDKVMTMSIGIAVYPQDGAEASQLVSSADAAMYLAKEGGRNTYEIFSAELRTRAHERLAVETGLHRAIEEGELVVYYQPQVDVRTGRIVGAEALVRWMHPERGLLLPAEFVPIAEQSGLVVALGEVVLRTACEQNRAWQKAGLPPVVMAVNVSARQFRHGIADATAAALRQSGLEPQWLQLELTESAAIDNMELTLNSLKDIRAMGVGCALDDFGTGYCGLKYLSELPISAIKIDKSFIQAMSVRDAAIVTATINLGHGLGLRMVAEGVESQAQLRCLTSQGCDEVQGYLFSRPVPAAAFAELLAAQQPMLRDGVASTTVVDAARRFGAPSDRPGGVMSVAP